LGCAAVCDGAFLLGVVVEFFLVGLGLFSMHAGSTIDNAHSLNAHRAVGYLVSVVGGVLLLVLTLLAWPKPRRILGLYLLLFILAFPVQPFLAIGGVHHRFVGMLHPVNAAILLGLSGYLAHYAWASRRDETPETIQAPVPSG
jgi:hypothetical protein